MQVCWEHLTPSEFKNLVDKEKVCVLPIGVLERHGEHLPFGTDALTVHTIAVKAAQLEPCVVFPPYWFGQIHEAACFTGAVNFPQRLLLEMLETLLDQIGQNGFEKILILNGHGGNQSFLNYFAITQIDREVNYTLYYSSPHEGTQHEKVERLWETGGGHADESETSIMMSIAPDSVKLEYQCFEEPIAPLRDLSYLRVNTALGWYSKFPEQVSGCPSRASKEKGEQALRIIVEDVAEMIRNVKADTIVPALQKEFYQRVWRRD
jgi:creatinine amidohydrolase